MTAILAVDAGNTRIKWGLYRAGAWLESGACPTGEAGALTREWTSLPEAPGAVYVANVAGETAHRAIADAAARWPVAPVFVVARAQQCGVRSCYRDPAQLGCDRWAALIGARQLHPGAALVVHAGTALTVDALTDEGVFLGGIIAPGLDLMRRALEVGTAGLPLQAGEVRFFPDNTGDAIMSGAAHAMAGAVERMAAFMEQVGVARIQVLLGGGAAETLRPLLSLDTSMVENLVLEGLVAIAQESQA